MILKIIFYNFGLQDYYPKQLLQGNRRGANDVTKESRACNKSSSFIVLLCGLSFIMVIYLSLHLIKEQVHGYKRSV